MLINPTCVAVIVAVAAVEPTVNVIVAVPLTAVVAVADDSVPSAGLLSEKSTVPPETATPLSVTVAVMVEVDVPSAGNVAGVAVAQMTIVPAVPQLVTGGGAVTGPGGPWWRHGCCHRNQPAQARPPGA